MIKYKIDLDSVVAGGHLVADKTLAYESSGSAEIDVRIFPSHLSHLPRCGFLALPPPKYHSGIDAQPMPNTVKSDIHNIYGRNQFTIRRESLNDQTLADCS